MAKDGIPLPSALAGVEVERLIRIDEALLFLVTGALAELTDDWNLEQTGTLTADDARELLSDMLWCFMGACDVTPIGTVSMFAGATLPDKWLKCEGQSLVRATYADLFAVIGTVYGAADGTHFNLPDMRFRSPMHPGTSADTLDTLGLGGALGENRHTLLTVEMPSHNHTPSDPGHTHEMKRSNNVTSGTTWRNVEQQAGVLAGSAFTEASTTGITIGNRGGDAAHNTLHPVLGVNFIIFTGVL